MVVLEIHSKISSLNLEIKEVLEIINKTNNRNNLEITEVLGITQTPIQTKIILVVSETEVKATEKIRTQTTVAQTETDSDDNNSK